MEPMGKLTPPSEEAVYTIDSISDSKVVSLGFEPRSAGPEPTMMDRYTKRLAGSPMVRRDRRPERQDHDSRITKT